MTPAVSGAPARRLGRGAALALLTALASLLLVLGTGAAPAQAHAELVGTTPEDGAVFASDEAPASVELRFTEGVRLIDGAIRLFSAGAEPQALSAEVIDGTVVIELPEDLDEGAYALGWRVVSADTHPIGGVIDFQVGEGPFPPLNVTMAITDPAITDTVVEVLLMLQYLGLLLLAGLLFFDRVVQRASGPVDAGTRRLLRIAFWVAVSASTVLVLASGVRVTGRELVATLPSGDWTILAPETWVPGLTWQTIAAAGLVLVAGAVALAVGTRATSTAGRATAIASAVVALAAPVLVGHTQTVQPGWATIAADLGHLLAGAFWFGGTVGLLRVLVRSRPEERGGEPRVSPVDSARLVARFSRFAMIAVVVLGLSGLTMAVLILGSWGDLIGTEYGRTLLLKLGIVVVVIALAAWNRTKLVPRVLARPTGAEQWAGLRRTLGYEVTLIIAVIAVTGVLTNTSPTQGGPGDASGAGGGAQQAVVQIESQGLEVDGVFAPAQTGENTFAFTLAYDGEPLDAAQVEVTARLPEQQLGPFTAEVAFDEASGEYTAVVNLPVAGEWQLQVMARVDAFTQPIALAAVTIR